MRKYSVSPGKHQILLAGCTEIAPGYVFGTAQAALTRIPTGNASLSWDERDGPFVGNLRLASSRDKGMTNESNTPPSSLLVSLDPDQRRAFFDSWKRIPNHLRDIRFDLQDPE